MSEIKTINSREAARQQLAAMVSEYRGDVAILPGFSKPIPRKVRSDRVDPETVLRRTDRVIAPKHSERKPQGAAESERFRAMADSL
jgi:hypothetical protein